MHMSLEYFDKNTHIHTHSHREEVYKYITVIGERRNTAGLQSILITDSHYVMIKIFWLTLALADQSPSGFTGRMDASTSGRRDNNLFSVEHSALHFTLVFALP